MLNTASTLGIPAKADTGGKKSNCQLASAICQSTAWEIHAVSKPTQIPEMWQLGVELKWVVAMGQKESQAVQVKISVETVEMLTDLSDETKKGEAASTIYQLAKDVSWISQMKLD